jgi:hypothetical protein
LKTKTFTTKANTNSEFDSDVFSDFSVKKTVFIEEEPEKVENLIKLDFIKEEEEEEQESYDQEEEVLHVP